jgi:hypothetical protein
MKRSNLERIIKDKREREKKVTWIRERRKKEKRIRKKKGNRI